MRYEQVVTSVDQKITEHYVIDGKEYDALLAIRGIGWIAGTAGYEEHVVSITLESGGNMAGRLTIEFPRTKKGEVHACRMLETTSSRGAANRFSTYAERQIERIVRKFVLMRYVWQEEALGLEELSVDVSSP